MKPLLYFILAIMYLSVLNSCKSNEPEANLLVGSWNLTSLKLESDSTWKEVNIGSQLNVIFKGNGSISSVTTNPIGGGWCNVAEKYTLNDKQLHFEFGEAHCIPFLDPKVPELAQIVEISEETLLIKWGNRLLTFVRS